ncbi:MAG: hypothetical protein AB8H47_09010 [Bacteroidia bacterium]
MDQKARMRQLSPKELVAIIENSQDYRPEVVAFAEAELESRDIDPEETAQIRIQVLKDQDESIKRKKAEKDDRKWILDTLKEFVAERSKLVLIACIFLAVYLIIKLPEALSLISFIIENNLAWDWSNTEMVLPIVLLIAGMFGLLFEKVWAWMLSVGVLSYYLFKLIVSQILRMENTAGSVGDLLAESAQGTTYVSFSVLLCLTLVPLIILYLATVRKRLSVPKWAFYVAPPSVFAFVMSLFLLR